MLSSLVVAENDKDRAVRVIHEEFNPPAA